MNCIAPKCVAPAAPGGPFCATCLQAPAGRRGGWLSAHRRQEIRGAGAALDANSVAKRLWIGGVPPFDRDLENFDVLVLCAQEHQPVTTAFHGEVVRCPLPDSALTPGELARALNAGRVVARALAAGKTCLVTCHAGRNRSALVAGLGLGLVTRASADRIIRTIRQNRSPIALSNDHFVALLRTYVPGRKRRITSAVAR